MIKFGKLGFIFSICLILSILSILLIELSTVSQKNSLTGRSVSAALSIFIMNSEDVVIYILSPLNVTYNFGIGSNYTLDLNVSSPNDIVSWYYTLDDLRHNTTIYNMIPFLPNTTFNAVRWNNRLTVFANTTLGNMGNKSVEFYINVPPSAPVLANISDRLYACEASAFNYQVNVTNLDEDPLIFSLVPTNPFFVSPATRPSEGPYDTNIVSGVLSKSRIGNYSETISVSDGTYSDSKNFNISVIEINNPPVIDNIGVQTIWIAGENSTFFKQVIVNDIESGNSSSGNFTFNITFLNGASLFNISRYGIMNFTPNSSQVNVYNIQICVTDNAISNIHPNISLCNQNGLNQTSCQNFSLTITNENRAPYFVNWYPLSLSFNASGNTNIEFNASVKDDDGTLPDIYWYVNDVFAEYNSSNNTYFFDRYFSCNTNGVQRIKAEITDGLLNSSLQWNITFTPVSCESPGAGGGSGGGGGGGPRCVRNFVCDAWNICQNLEESFISNVLTRNDYNIFKGLCVLDGFNQSSCGFQIRSCYDLNKCDFTGVDVESEHCLFVLNPSCFDSVKNCHAGSCEVLTDCGGPCDPCTTCSDGIKNQGERGIDCGSPCPNACEIKPPLIGKEELKYTFYIILIILLLLIIFVIINVIRLIKVKREIGELKWYRLTKGGG